MFEDIKKEIKCRISKDRQVKRKRTKERIKSDIQNTPQKTEDWFNTLTFS
jgi:gas vesicle protein